MPQLPQYQTQARPQGIVRGVIPGEVNVLPAVALAQRGADAYQAGQDKLAALREREAEQRARESEQLAREEAQAAVSLTISNKRAEYAAKIITRQQSGEPMAGMTADLLKEFDADAEKTIAAAPEIGRRALTVRMGELKSHLHEKAFGIEADARRAQVVTDFSTGLDADARLLFADHTQLPGVLGARLAAANALTLDEQTKAKLLDSTRETLAYSAASGLVDRNPDAFLARTGNAGGKTGKDGKPLPADPAKAAEAIKNDPMLSNMRPAQLQQLTERATSLIVTREAQRQAEIERQRSRAEAAANKADREAGQAYTIMRDMVQGGYRIDTSNPEVKQMMAKMQAVPAYSKAFSTMAEQAPANAAAAVLPIKDQEAQLNAYYAQRSANGTSPALEAEIKRREGVLSNSVSGYKDDALVHGEKVGVIAPQAPLDMTSLDTIAKGLAGRAAAVDLVSQKAGRTISPLRDNEAAQVRQKLDSLAPSDQAGAIATLTKAIGTRPALAMAEQIAKDDQVLRLQIQSGADMTASGRLTSEWIGRGRQAVKENSQKAKDAHTLNVRALIADEVGDAVSGPARADIIEAAYMAYVGEAASGMHPSPKGVTELVLRGPIVEHNGKRIPVPVGGLDKFRDQLRAMPADAIKVQAPDGMVYGGGGGPKTIAQFLAGLPDAQLETAGQGRYVVRSGSGVAVNSKGAPIFILAY